MDLIHHACPKPAAWLDTGCGTGALIRRALPVFSDTNFFLADPSADMLDMARSQLRDEPRCRFINASSQELEFPDNTFDAVTAVLAHHYLDAPERGKAERNIFRMLRQGGIYVTCEHTSPMTETGRLLTLARWRDFQHAAGKPAEKAAEHTARYGESYFPISMSEHIRLLQDCGFSTVEILWASYCDVVFYAIK